MSDKKPEVWMRGPIDGVELVLQPIVFAFRQVKEDIDHLVPALSADALWTTPGGAASLGFHLDHIGGATDRLLTYARGESLTPEQFTALKAEGVDHSRSLSAIVERTHAQLDRAIAQVTETPFELLATPRKIGRAGLPTTIVGLLFHAAEHATRHAGQAITTARVVSAAR